MLSFHYKNSHKQLTRFRRLCLHLFLDSGAFSAWRKDVEVDLADYMQYIRENSIGKYIVLNIVGDPESRYFNLKRMEQEGLQSVPVFHMVWSDLRYLQQLADEGYHYVCLGGSVGAGVEKRRKIFDECFGEFPEIYFHGLGMTEPQLMPVYPLFSVDSTTWLVGHGRLAVSKARESFYPKICRYKRR